MATEIKQIPDWIAQAQEEAKIQRGNLEALPRGNANSTKDHELDTSLVGFMAAYKYALEPFFAELEGAGYLVEDLGLGPKLGQEVLDRNILFALKQKYPEAGISFDLNEVKAAESTRSKGKTTQTWSITTADLADLAQLEIAPMEHEVKGFVGAKISIRYAGITVPTDEPKLSQFVLEVASPEELDSQRVFIQNSLAEIIVYKEKMQVLMQEENKDLRTKAFTDYEEAQREAKYHQTLQELLTHEISKESGITPLELFRRLIDKEADYSALRRELFTLRTNQSIFYKDGKFFTKNPQE